MCILACFASLENCEKLTIHFPTFLLVLGRQCANAVEVKCFVLIIVQSVLMFS